LRRLYTNVPTEEDCQVFREWNLSKLLNINKKISSHTIKINSLNVTRVTIDTKEVKTLKKHFYSITVRDDNLIMRRMR